MNGKESRAFENLADGGHLAPVVLLTRAGGHTGDGDLLSDSI